MAEIKLTEEDLKIIYGRSAIAAFLSSVAGALQALAERPDGEALQDFLLKALQDDLKKVSSPHAPHPMRREERERLRQLYRVFLGFYRHPTLPVNLPSDSTKH